MAAENLRRLIERVAPGRSVRQLTAAAGVPENRLAHYLRPGTVLSRMPTIWQIKELAQVIGCSSEEVYRAFRADVDGSEGVVDTAADERALLAADERALLAAYRNLAPDDRPKLLRIAKALNAE